MIDPLTGIFNRRGYRERIDQLIGRERRIFSLVVLDIDHFKGINDSYGHKTGDRLIQKIVAFTNKIIRNEDFFARYGGDEFIIVLVGLDRTKAVDVAEKIRIRISQTSFQLQRNVEKFIDISLSMGVAEARPDDTAQSVFDRADKALYLAKERGRNRVCSDVDL
ncbi:MAG: GGDEF domain-containing protein [Deltaproteobacteria bacterium]|nr:GGDEF domain-containing protein [Deltaproteobacteria bacterium]